MRMLFTTVAMAAVTIACSSPCSAELVVEAVSKDRAEKLGMEFRFKPGSGDTVWIEFEFKTDTELKMFREPDRRNRVELKVYGENKQFLAMARLREERSKDGAEWKLLMEGHYTRKEAAAQGAGQPAAAATEA